MSTESLAMFGLPGGADWIAIALVALLIFGRRLPDVARSVGKSIVEFKKGIKDVKDDIEVKSRIEPPKEEAKLERKPETPAEPTAKSKGEPGTSSDGTTESAPNPP